MLIKAVYNRKLEKRHKKCDLLADKSHFVILRFRIDLLSNHHKTYDDQLYPQV